MNLRLVRAGHNSSLFYSSTTRECTEVKQNGMGLGLTNGTMFRNSIEELSITPESGDIVLLYSDGLTEAMNSQSEEFGLQRLRGLLVRHSHDTATQIADEIIKEVNKFRGYAEIHDDITFILLKKN